VNYALGNIDDAIHDFNRCIEFDPNYAKAFFSRGKIYFKRKQYDKAIKDFEATIKNSIALQEIQWNSRLLVAECYSIKGNLKKAIFNLKLFTNRKFPPGSRLHAFKKKALFDYAEVLIRTEAYEGALKAIEKAMNLPSESESSTISMDQLLTLRGKARHLIGAQGFAADWKKAADLGSKEAKELLTLHSAK
jgi:tetratricopeptide (TPR) repeat protein